MDKELNTVEQTYYEGLLHAIEVVTNHIEDEFKREFFKGELIDKVDVLVDILLGR